MNTVSKPLFKEQKTNYKLGELILCNGGVETAFIGRCGCGPRNELYLITYDKIIKADEPKHSWESEGCSVYINQFVNIHITVQEK